MLGIESIVLKECLEPTSIDTGGSCLKNWDSNWIGVRFCPFLIRRKHSWFFGGLACARQAPYHWILSFIPNLLFGVQKCISAFPSLYNVQRAVSAVGMGRLDSVNLAVNWGREAFQVGGRNLSSQWGKSLMLLILETDFFFLSVPRGFHSFWRLTLGNYILL